MDTTLEISGEPVPASRPRVGKRGTYYPKKHTMYAERLKQILANAKAHKTERPVEVRILCVMPPYKTSNHPVHRADVDNLAKLPMDGMTKSERYWKDDDLVVHLVGMKRFAREGEEPHTKVRIIDIEEDVEDYIDRQFWN